MAEKIDVESGVFFCDFFKSKDSVTLKIRATENATQMKLF